MILRKAIAAALLTTAAIAPGTYCVAIQEPTLSILAICEPAISWFRPAYCHLCMIKKP